MRPSDKMSSWPFPSRARPEYRGLRLAAIAACIDPAFAPPGYNDVCRRLWRRHLAARWVTTSEELAEVLEGLSELLRDEAMSDDPATDTEKRAALRAGKRRLDALYEEARRSGLLLE
jgi:hypothetical protein